MTRSTSQQIRAALLRPSVRVGQKFSCGDIAAGYQIAADRGTKENPR